MTSIRSCWMGKIHFSPALLVILLCSLTVSGLFQFKRYSYRKKSGNDRRFRLEEERCQSLDDCRGKHGTDKEKCVRICISSSCYDELYAWNELEEGEIDVRLTSFKGCVVQQIREKEMEERRNGQL